MRKWHYIEGIASFFIVGLGQILHGESSKGLKMILAVYLAVPFAVFSSLAINGYLFLLVLAICSMLAISIWINSIWTALTFLPPRPLGEGVRTVLRQRG